MDKINSGLSEAEIATLIARAESAPFFLENRSENAAAVVLSQSDYDTLLSAALDSDVTTLEARALAAVIEQGEREAEAGQTIAWQGSLRKTAEYWRAQNDDQAA